MFFEDSRGVLYPVAQIDSIREKFVAVGSKPDYYGYSIQLRDGERVYVAKSDVDRIRRMTAGPIIAAAPGTYLLTFSGEKDDVPLREVVIAWQPDGYAQLAPVIVDHDIIETGDGHAILHPDGTVADFIGASWASVEEYIACRIAEVAEMRAIDAQATSH